MQTHNFDVDITTPSTNQKIKINKDFIEVNNDKIACEDVKAVKYGVSLLGGTKKPNGKEYNIDILGKNDKTISIRFKSNKVEDLLEEDHTYYYIMSGVWQYVKKYLVSHFIEVLNNKSDFSVGNTQITHQGFMLEYSSGFLFWKKQKIELVPWANLKYYLNKGILYVESLDDRSKKATFSLHHDWNAVVLNTLLHYLWQDHRKEKLAKGQEI
ncbi:hypothetical protein [Pedobacter arcticus]|uniref:hypothetical protein n=1 Tax=Pedobacter arcticus TaxID=752140 RepID=UPI0002E74340|nr:hypothetical protein [Pedobacter arcticus]